MPFFVYFIFFYWCAVLRELLHLLKRHLRGEFAQLSHLTDQVAAA